MSTLFIVSNILWLITAIIFYDYHQRMMQAERKGGIVEGVIQVMNQANQKVKSVDVSK